MHQEIPKATRAAEISSQEGVAGPVFNRFYLEEMYQDYENKKLLINHAQEILGDSVEVNLDENDWVSVANTSERTITIGLQQIPQEVVTRWGWGVFSEGDQRFIKASHEHAHFIQHFFDRDLVKFLDNKFQDVREFSAVYLKLYAHLGKIGRISGLPDEQVYKDQTKKLKDRGSILDMSTYEDFAEMIGAWMLGANYFNFRLDNSKTLISREDRKELWDLLNELFLTWAEKEGEEKLIKNR